MSVKHSTIHGWDLPKDSQFHPVDKDLLEATQFASFLVTKDTARVTETKFF